MTGPGQPDLLALRRSRIDFLMRLGDVAGERLAGMTRRLESETHDDRLLTTLSICYARISRWIRLIITLCFHIERGAWDEPRPPRPMRSRREAAVEPLAESRLMEAELRPGRDPRDDERPEREERFDSYLARPFGEVVALICRGLDITPDWDAWSAEPWAQEELRTRPPTSPYAAWPDDAPRAVPSPPTVIPAEDCEAVRRAGTQGPPARSREPPPPPQGSRP